MHYLMLAAIAAVGFGAGLWCHILGWSQVEPAGGKSFLFLFHIGIFVVWIPLVRFANRTMPGPGRNNLDHLLAELPSQMRAAVGVLFAYALLNFVYFIYCTRQYPKHEVPLWLELRGFSGHWMMFYGIAATGFIALARLNRRRKENG